MPVRVLPRDGQVQARHDAPVNVTPVLAKAETVLNSPSPPRRRTTQSTHGICSLISVVMRHETIRASAREVLTPGAGSWIIEG